MFTILRLCLDTIARLFYSRRNLLLENLVLRQQLVVFKRRHPRPRLNGLDKLFWVAAQRLWSEWKNSLVVVTLDTVVRWHQAGFRFYWRLISRVRKPLGRKRLPREVRDLIFRMVAENPTWGAPRIHGELVMFRFRCLRENHFPLDAQSAERS
jgi:putative transposase